MKSAVIYIFLIICISTINCQSQSASSIIENNRKCAPVDGYVSVL